MDKQQIRETIARRAAKELQDGYVVNLGIGLPTLIPNYLADDVHVTIHSENGLLGMGAKPAPGEEDEEFTDAGGAYTTANPGAALFDSATSFGYVRGGHVDVTILGALQTDSHGNLANWCIPGKKTPGMGGAMDLLAGARRVILAMEHTAKGNHKILEEWRRKPHHHRDGRDGGDSGRAASDGNQPGVQRGGCEGSHRRAPHHRRRPQIHALRPWTTDF